MDLSKFENHFKLTLLLTEANKHLAEIFKQKYKKKFKSEWKDYKQSTDEFQRKSEQMRENLNESMLTNFKKHNVSDWDITLLRTVLIKMFKNKDSDWVQEITSIRNYILHSSDFIISDEKFEDLYAKYSKAMVSLGYSKEELDKHKNDIDQRLRINPKNDNSDVEKIKIMAIEEIDKKNYLDAVKLYTNMLDSFENLSSQQTADLYYERSVAYLLCYENLDHADNKYLHRSLLDGKRSNNLEPRWSKTYYHIGVIYNKLNELEDSESYLEKALALDVSNEKVKNLLALTRNKKGEQDRHEHLNSIFSPGTTEERNRGSFARKYEQIGFKISESLLHKYTENSEKQIAFVAKYDPTFVDVCKGHEYRDGSLNVKQDYIKAASYYGKAAQKNNPEALYNLALFHKKGLGVKLDYKLAISLLEQAASQNPMRNIQGNEIPNVGVAEGEHSLGLAYNQGVYVEKDTRIAAEWYAKAVKHNNSNAANNLGILYMDGDGVEQNLDKAEELFLLSHKLNNTDCIHNLIQLYFLKEDPERVLMWHQRACEMNDHLAISRDKDIRESCEKLSRLVNFKKTSNIENDERVKAFEELLDFNEKWSSKKISPLLVGEKLKRNQNIDDLDLIERASNGSVIAENLIEARTNFFDAISIMDFDKYGFVSMMSNALKLESITWSINEKQREKALTIIEEIIGENENKNSDVDCDARICYMYLKPYKSIEFTSNSLKKYPENLTMLEYRGCMYCFEKEWDKALIDFNTLLKADPHNFKYLYHKAAALFQSLDSTNKMIEKSKINIKDFELFLEHSPKDYKKVPEAYYTIAILSKNLILEQPNNEKNCFENVRTYYEKGIESEKFILPFNLPYLSDKKKNLELYLKTEKIFKEKSANDEEINDKHLKQSNLNVQKIITRDLIINDYRRIALVLDHRKYYHDTENYGFMMPITIKPPKKQKFPVSLSGLKEVFLKDVDFSRDHIMNGYILTLINIDLPIFNPPPRSIRLNAQDEHGIVERVAIYNLNENKDKVFKMYPVGIKFSIINPYIRMAADFKPIIRIDDPRTLILTEEKQNLPCRSCLKENSKFQCAKCHKAKYCSRECQIDDWKIFQHKLICLQ